MPPVGERPATDPQGEAVAHLVKRAADGDSGAWDALVERFSPLVWSVTRSLGLGRADAADVFQTTWLRLVEHLGRVREPERLGGWLAVTARHEGYRTLRRAGRALPTDDESTFDAPAAQAELDGRLLADERDRDLWGAFARIPERCRGLLRLLVADPPLSYQQIAELLDMPIGGIGPTRARCLDKLRVVLTETGISTDPAGS
jgi:RNA polymerase sigma factor (sigma-70 family)